MFRVSFRSFRVSSSKNSKITFNCYLLHKRMHASTLRSNIRKSTKKILQKMSNLMIESLFSARSFSSTRTPANRDIVAITVETKKKKDWKNLKMNYSQVSRVSSRNRNRNRSRNSSSSSAGSSDRCDANARAVVEDYRRLPLDARTGLDWVKSVKERPKNQRVNKIELDGEKERSFKSLRVAAKTIVYETNEVEEKISMTHAAFRQFLNGEIDVCGEDDFAVGEETRTASSASSASASFYVFPERPARPETPKLVMPFSCPSPKNSPLPFSAHVLHTVAHIELNAIDLAWDTVCRFSDPSHRLPREFFLDFARVADDESRHLSWCLQRLGELGHSYGEIDAHDMLWLGCYDSRENELDRMAVVPMAQEARGLDAGPRLREKLVGRGDNRSAAIIERITNEELNHVAVGVFWFRKICIERENIVSEEQLKERFLDAVERLTPDILRGPFAHDEREKAGFQRNWYDKTADSSSNSNSAEELKARLELIVNMEERMSS